MKFGLSVQNLTSTLRDRMAFREKGGVLITSVLGGSFAEDIGLQRGDVIMAINKQPGTNTVDTVDGIVALLPDLQKALPASVTLAVRSDRSQAVRDSVHDIKFTLLLTVVLVVLVIRTRLSPFWHSRPSRPLLGAIVGALAAAVLIPLSPVGPALGFEPLPPVFWLVLAVLVAAYLALVELVKRRFVTLM